MDDDHHRRRRRFIDEQINLVNNNDLSVTEISLQGDEPEDQIRALFWGMQKNTPVRKLDLCWTPQELRRTVCQQFLPLLLRENSSMEYLRFPCGMMNTEFEFAEEVLRNNNTSVKTLNLDPYDIRGHDGGEIIARLIRNNTNITTINLWDNTNLGPAGAMRIAAALGNDDHTLKTLNLGRCGIGDEGVDALCTALQVNTSLETFRFYYYNRITDEDYRALARSLPHMRGIKKIRFGWEQSQVSPAVLQPMMDGLRKNQSLQRIYTLRDRNLSEEQSQEWNTCRAFVGARNKMKSHLDEVHDAARDGRVAIPIGPLLCWCRRQGNLEVQASLIYSLLRSRSNKLVGLADIAAEDG